MAQSYSPYDEQIERAILSCYMNFEAVRNNIENRVRSEDFFVPSHAALWGYIYKYITTFKGIFEYHSFLSFLKTHNDPQVKKHNLLELTKNIQPEMQYSSAGIEQIIAKLKDLSKRRELIWKCQGIIEVCQKRFDAEEIGDLIKDFDLVMETANKRVLSKEISQWVDETEGWWSVTNCDKELQIVTTKDKQNRRAILSRLTKSQIIERDPNRDGFYRRMEKDCDEINLVDAISKPMDIRWVFGLEQYVNTYPKTISIISGSQNAGKTALMLNMAKMNKNKFDTHYFSSEMDATELKSRLVEFEDVDLDYFENVKFWDRSRNFADVVKPDAINFIDYFEIDDNFYRINKQLAEIRNRLRNGIAIIALQKDKGKELGRGATFSLEKARLYLTVDPDYPGAKIKVVKGKNWAHRNINPDGLCMKFKLYRGVNLIPQGSWSLE